MYKVYIIAKGSGGANNFKHYLSEDKISYILLRLSIIEHMGVAKVALITYVGKNVRSAFTKALSTGHRHNLYEYARNYISVGGQYQPEELDELTDNEIISKITGQYSRVISGGERREVKMTPQERWEATKQIGPNIVIKDKNQFTGKLQLIEFTGKEEIKNALKELVSQKIDYIKLGISGSKYTDITIEEKGGKDLLSEEWRKKHLDLTSWSIFVIALETKDSGYGILRKYLFIQWIGNNVKPLIKSKVGVVKPSLFKFIDGKNFTRNINIF